MDANKMLRWCTFLALSLIAGCGLILGIEPLQQQDGGVPDAAPDPSCVNDSPCDTGLPCELGATQCVNGQPLCVAVGIASADSVCRLAAGPCDVAEYCDGETTGCPADALVATGASCRVGEEAGSCTGLSVDCIAGCVSGTPCDTGNACELGTIDCSTGDPQCIAIGIKGQGTMCREAAGLCDVPEVCDGSSPGCPDDRFLPSTEMCRPSQGLCDPAETCTGSGAACPENELVGDGIECRGAANLCDVADVCDGSSPDCPDAVKPAGAPCGSVNGLCDAPDFCDGSSKSCLDTVQPAGTECRPASGGLCDLADSCDGSNKTCPDTVKPAGSECRPVANQCDVADVCDGSTSTCPADAKRPDGTPCSGSLECNEYECRSGACVVAAMLCGACGICGQDGCQYFCEPGCGPPCPS